MNGTYAPGAVGFNLADVTYGSEVQALPAGVKALVWLGESSGVTSTFQQKVQDVMNAAPSKVFGFYLDDEPLPSATTAANFRAESNWIHQNYPGVKTFIVEYNEGSSTNHSYYYNPANSGVDLYGLDPYPVQSGVSGGFDLNIINNAVQAAESIGIPQSALIPTYQAFADSQGNNLPTASQVQQDIARWGSLVPNPAFDYTYTWGVADGTTSLSSHPELQAVFKSLFSGTGGTGGGTTTGGGGGSTASAIPKVTITSTGGYVPRASQTVTGTATPNSTVTILDQGTKIGSVAVGANGAWSDTVSLIKHFGNTVTATDTTAAGTATSNTVTYFLNQWAPLASAISAASLSGSATTQTATLAATQPTLAASLH